MIQSNPNRLKQLLEESQQLTSHITPTDLPALQRGLGQIESESRRLVSRTILEPPGSDAKGHFLLASGGVDPDKLSRAIRSFNLATTFEPVQTIPDTDVEGYLNYQREQLIVNALESGYRETCQDFEVAYESAFQADWQRAKQRLLEELGQPPAQTDRGSGSSGGGRGARASGNDATIDSDRFFAGLGDRSADLGGRRRGSSLQLNPRMQQYAAAVETLNDKRLQHADCTVVAQFEEVARTLSGDDRSQQMITSWNLLSSILDERIVAGGKLDTSSALMEAEFSDAYLHSNYDSLTAVQVRTYLIRGARHYLHEQFVQYVERILAQYPREAQMGGVPSIHNKIQAYLNVKLARSDSSQENLEKNQGQPVWAHMYYLFRAGYPKEALQYALRHENFLVQNERNFLTYLKAYLDDQDHRLPKSLRDRLQGDYQRVAHNAHNQGDPYKLAMLKLIGRCELARKSVPAVVQTTEDYIWLQLMLIRETSSSEEVPDERYTLRDLQKLLLRFGANHFNPNGNNPVLYFQVLLLSAQFEQAVGYLLQLESYRIEAVHFAIALAYYGLIRVTPLDQPMGVLDYLTTVVDAEGHEIYCLNFNKILGDYVYRFGPADAPSALHYVFLLRLHSLLPDKDSARVQHQAALASEAIQGILLDTADYGHLLGEVQRDGSRSEGFLERYQPLLATDPATADTLQLITKQAAENCRRDGRLGEAILLYNMAEEYDTVIALIILQLGEILSNPTERNHLARLGENILDHYLRYPHIQAQISTHHRETCIQILSLLDFMVAHEQGRFDAALLIIEKLDLIPLDADVAVITRRAEQLRDLDEAVSRNFPDILLATMDTLSHLYNQTKQSQFLDATKQSQLALYRKKGRSVMVLAGMIQFRMPPDTYSKLNRLDVFMH
ncbi:hypothetical protein BJ085DRAFT_16606 [Dimargaris cristalligena]|uniref:Nuclear pore protein n=1 Tax=Dimargaris cristalligena TaxID=215637 RepID=A0A4P9ZPW9_9FUNG|nr:hypothetical protein BJ085DRAFT_16606 [Dimargaris cristalligena]|eukprot:RKP34751.1 hypothetical protein BJ085DRAFT_16606 [Dimargaris cristalligena]